MIATITASETWPPGRVFTASPERIIAELVLDGALAAGDLVSIGDTTYRILEGRVLRPLGPGPWLRAVEPGRAVAQFVPLTAAEVDVIEFLENSRTQAAAWAERQPVGHRADVGAYWDREEA